MLFVLAATALAATPAPAPAPAAPAPAATTGGPTVPACQVVSPAYTVDGKPLTTGLAFAMKIGDKQILVTAHSMFGPSGGLAEQIPAAQLAGRVTALTARDAFTTSTICGRTTKVLPVADAAPLGQSADASRDLAVFEVPAATGYDATSAVTHALAPLAFSAKATKVGDRVFVLAPVNGKPGLSSWPAKVVQVDAGYLFFQYDDNTLDLAGTTGAPVVDAAGGLLGVNLSVGKMDDGSLIGGATPPAATKQRIEAAAK